TSGARLHLRVGIHVLDTNEQSPVDVSGRRETDDRGVRGRELVGLSERVYLIAPRRVSGHGLERWGPVRKLLRDRRSVGRAIAPGVEPVGHRDRRVEGWCFYKCV